MEKAIQSKHLQDPLASRLGYLLRRASTVMMEDVGRALSEVHLRPVEGTILILIGSNPGCIQSDIGQALGIKRANMVPLISGLLARGYIEKAPVNGRSIALTLSESGKAVRARVDEIMDAHEAHFEKFLAARDRDKLKSALRLIAAAQREGVAIDGL